MLQLIDKKNKILVYLLFLITLSTITNKTFENKENYSILINEIIVTGLSNNNNTQIIYKLNKLLNKNIFFVHKKEINKIILEYPIIEQYSVKKIYPSRLNLEIKPTTFIAKIPGNDQLLVGSNGKLIKNEITAETVPYLFGEFDSLKFLKFKNIIDQSNFNFNEFRSIFFFKSNRWDVLTINDILIKLPENNLSESLNIAYQVTKNDEFQGSKIIDLRISNHLIVQ